MTNVLAFRSKAEKAPSNENRKVKGAKRPTNGDMRPREYLEEHEVERLIEGARKSGRYGHRDATLILLAFRHGLRVSELAALQWGQVNLKSARLYVRRRKNGLESTQPLTGRELRMLRVLHREAAGSPFVFNTERGSGITEDNVRKIVERAGKRRVSRSRFTRTCSDTPADMPWRTREPIRGRSRTTSGTEAFSIQSVIPSSRQGASMGYSRTNGAWG